LEWNTMVLQKYNCHPFHFHPYDNCL
jgi:hypothetical protein